MKVFSLFSGIGGFDIAARNLGWQIVGACEIDKYARSVYARHFPGITIHNDATKVQAESLSSFDMLCGGFPCQAFSVAGKRLGFDDTRGTLFYEIARIAKEKRPRYLLLENVKGLLSHNKGETLRAIFRVFDEVGYDAEWQVINSKYFVPQNRERIFIIGHLRGSSTRQVFPLGEIHSGNNKTQQETCSEGQRIQDKISETIDANYSKGHGSRTMIAINPYTSQHYRCYKHSGLSPTLNSSSADCNSHNTLVYLSQKNSNMKQRIQNRDTSWTLTNNGGDFGIKQDSKIRRLTPTECERLQGFPDDYTKFGKDGELISNTQHYRCLGNAVTVPVVQYIMEKISITDELKCNEERK